MSEERERERGRERKGEEREKGEEKEKVKDWMEWKGIPDRKDCTWIGSNTPLLLHSSMQYSHFSGYVLP